MAIFASQREGFTCTQCGKCCQVDKDMWLGGDLTWQQKQDLLTERDKYPANKTGCKMLYFEQGLSHCLVVEQYSDKRDCNCKNYPGEELCVRELENGN